MTSTRKLAYIAIGTALIAALSQVVLPIGPVPFTLQTLAIGLVASLYPVREAVFSVGLYLFMGAIGLPVFAGFSGNITSLIGPTSGFLWGFLLYALVTSLLVQKSSSPLRIFLANLAGDSLCFVLGYIVLKYQLQLSWQAALSMAILPFVLPDLAKIILVTLSHRLLHRHIKQID